MRCSHSGTLARERDADADRHSLGAAFTTAPVLAVGNRSRELEQLNRERRAQESSSSGLGSNLN